MAYCSGLASSRRLAVLSALAPLLSSVAALVFASAAAATAIPLELVGASYGAVQPPRRWAAPAAFDAFAWPTDPRIRSAGKVRAQPALASEIVASIRSTEAERTSLRLHFAAVLEWLEAHRDESLEIAVRRLEKRRGRPLEQTARARLEALLGARRDHQLSVLAAYAEAGVFPAHSEYATSPTPLFVDELGTACAVGHLMRVDGHGGEVARISHTDNGVWVADLESGPVVEWVSTSGLTLEEAAVIQPGYHPGPVGTGAVDLVALSQPGSELILDAESGLKLLAFSIHQGGATQPGQGLPLAEQQLAQIDLVVYGPNESECLYLIGSEFCEEVPFTGPDEIGLLWISYNEPLVAAQPPSLGGSLMTILYGLVLDDPDFVLDLHSIWLPSFFIGNSNAWSTGDAYADQFDTLPGRFPDTIVGATTEHGARYAETPLSDESFRYMATQIGVPTNVAYPESQVNVVIQTYRVSYVPEPYGAGPALAGVSTLACLFARKRLRRHERALRPPS